FDGWRMFARHDQLEAIKELGEAELQQGIMKTVSEVMTTYFNLVQQKQRLNALDSTLVISKQRVDLAQNRFEIGKASKLELLNAQVDQNTAQTLYFRQQQLSENTRTRLNELTGREIKIDCQVVDLILVDESLDISVLEERAKAQNPQLQAHLI